MNKIIQVNLAGQAVSIDEVAYDTLKKYLSSLAIHFKTTDSGDEIIADIEARIAEIFIGESSNKSFIDQSIVDETIALMGTPFEMGYEETEDQSSQYTASEDTDSETNNKRLFRNTDDRWLGGVCSGIAAYINVEVFIVRIAFIVLFWTMLPEILYVIAWAILPKAVTAEDKMRMRGSKINVNDIANNIRNEANDFADRVKKNSNAHQGINAFSNILERFFNFFAKLFSGSALVFLVVLGTAITVGVLGHASKLKINALDTTFQAPLLFETPTLNWVFNISLLALILIPIGLICYGLVAFIFNLKQYANLKAGFVAWLLSLAVFVGVAAFGASDINFKGIEQFGEEVEQRIEERRQHHNNQHHHSDTTYVEQDSFGHS